MSKLTINPSSFELIHDGTTNAEYPAGCLRYQSVKHLLRDMRTELHPVYSAIGTLAEEYVAADPKLDPFTVREQSIEADLGDGVIAKGRADFVSANLVTEVKATISSSKRGMWRKGELGVTHWGQLASYLWLLDMAKGELRAFYFHFTKEDVPQLRMEPYRFTIDRTAETDAKVVLYYKTVKHAMIGDALPPRPLSDRPCAKCQLRAVCNSGPKDRDTFYRKVVSSIEQGLEPVVGFGEPRIKSHNTRQGSK